jgi:hypothetical protein
MQRVLMLPFRSRSSFAILFFAMVTMAFVLSGSGLANATIISATASSFTGDPLSVTLTIDDESDPGNLVITLEVDDGGNTGDLRGFFAQITDESLISGLSVSGSEITSSMFDANDVVNLGRGSNLNGGGSPCACDFGVEIGDPGIGRGDDYQSITFVLSHMDEDLTVALFEGQEFGVRVTSVGGDGNRSGSSKLIGVVPIPEPSTSILMFLGLAGLAAGGSRVARSSQGSARSSA